MQAAAGIDGEMCNVPPQSIQSSTETIMRLSMFHELDVREAARRVVTLSREQLGRVVGMKADSAALSKDNPYVTVFVSLFQYARGTGSDDASTATHLEVAQSVLGNPLYAGAEGTTEAPLLQVVVAAAIARRKERRGEKLTEEEAELLR
jgi:hypothetical protein